MTTTNKNIASIRTSASVSWATGLTLLVAWATEISDAGLVFIAAAATVVINRIGHELQSTTNRWAKMLGDILLWVDKMPVYETPPAPEMPKD